MSEIRFAIIGCGRIAPRHAQSLSRIEGVRLVAAVEPDLARASGFSREYGVPVFSSLSELLAGVEFDVACICTPSGLHREHAVELMEAGKHVVVEKPMALTVKDADEMVEVSRRNQVQLFVVKQNRCNLPVIALRRALEVGRFGKLVMGTVRVRWCRTQEYYDQDAWRGTWAMDGGVFANQASHHIDLLEWCMGEAESVIAKTTRSLVDIECEDTGAVLIKFKSGALGVVEATTATRPRDLEGSLSVLGESGVVENSGFAVNQIRHFNFTRQLPEDREIMEKLSTNPPNVYGFGHQAYLQNVVDTLRGKALPLVDGVEGKKSVELITAIYASVESGKEVEVRGRRQLTCKLGGGRPELVEGLVGRPAKPSISDMLVDAAPASARPL